MNSAGMRRLLFFVSCGVLAWTLWLVVPVHTKPDRQPLGSFEDRVFAMIEARDTVNREIRKRADAIRDRVVSVVERLPV
jgi:hypothetical protein